MNTINEYFNNIDLPLDKLLDYAKIILALIIALFLAKFIA
jgi:hypothetical protein